MVKKVFLFLWLISGIFVVGGTWTAAQDDSRILVNVVLVQLNVAVTDHKGNYISGLRPEDFSITEDKIQEKIATFEGGSVLTHTLVDTPGANSSAASDS